MTVKFVSLQNNEYVAIYVKWNDSEEDIPKNWHMMAMVEKDSVLAAISEFIKTTSN